MKFILPLLLTLSVGSLAFKGFDIPDDTRECINCLCHMTTGCYSRKNCANHYIDRKYWEEANKPKIQLTDNDDKAYKKCMKNEDCIVQTVINYTTRSGQLDCNCDGKFDCLDMAALHLNTCENFNLDPRFVERYNHCSNKSGTRTMFNKENPNLCIVKEV